VVSEEYATTIARDWNVKHSGQWLCDQVRGALRFPGPVRVRHVGDHTILEYWILGEDLAEFNTGIASLITATAEYRRDSDTDTTSD
jgi:hypothetical protein